MVSRDAVGFLVYFALGLGLYGKQELLLWQMPPAAPLILPGAPLADEERAGTTTGEPAALPKKRGASR